MNRKKGAAMAAAAERHAARQAEWARRVLMEVT
jgi:hypothetical protein